MSQTSAVEPFLDFKANQRKIWAGFAANEGLTILAAAELVAFARVQSGESVLDVACGTGVAAITAARIGAQARGLDLTLELLVRARENAKLAGLDVDFTEGDAEALPYPDASFDVVLSQFGHMFAPRPANAIAEMLRVLKPGGRIAFTTWPPEHVFGQLLDLVERNGPQPEPEAPAPAVPTQWGEPKIIRERLGDKVTGLRFARGAMLVPALSASHIRLGLETNFGPLKALLARLDAEDPQRAAAIRAEVVRLAKDNIEGNIFRQPWLMSQATKAS